MSFSFQNLLHWSNYLPTEIKFNTDVVEKLHNYGLIRDILTHNKEEANLRISVYEPIVYTCLGKSEEYSVCSTSACKYLSCSSDFYLCSILALNCTTLTNFTRRFSSEFP